MNDTPFARLALLGEELERTSKRRELAALLAGFLSELSPDEISPAVSLTIGRAFPEWDQRTLNVSWRTVMAVVDARHTLLLTGTGEVVQPADGVLGIGSGGDYAVAAARALVGHSRLGAVEIVRTALEIAAGIDVYTNTNIEVEELACET